MVLYEEYFEEPVQSKDKFVQFINLSIKYDIQHIYIFYHL